MKQYLIVCPLPFITGEAATIDEANQAILERRRRTGIRSDFDVVDRFAEPGEIENKYNSIGNVIFRCWRPA